MAYFNPAMISQFASMAAMAQASGQKKAQQQPTQFKYPTVASQLEAAQGERESPQYRRGVAQMTKVPDRSRELEDRIAADVRSSTGLRSSAPASTQPSFLSQVGDAYNKIAPDLFRGIAAGLASYQGDPMRPYSGAGEAMAATMQRSEQTREARRKMSLAGEEGAAAAQMEAGFEREMNKQNLGDFRGMAQPSEDDRRYFDDLVKMEGFKIGVPSSGVNKAMLAYTAANPFSATERERMEADMRRNLQSALRISF